MPDTPETSPDAGIRVADATTILTINRPTVDVPIPEIDDHTVIRIRVLTGGDGDQFEAIMSTMLTKDGKINPEKILNLRAHLAVRSIVDAEGNRIFKDSDLEFVSAIPRMALDKVFQAAMNLNEYKPKDLEELAKNSATAPEDDSSSE